MQFGRFGTLRLVPYDEAIGAFVDERKAALDELTQEAQKLGLGY